MGPRIIEVMLVENECTCATSIETEMKKERTRKELREQVIRRERLEQRM
jgi:hypothetical protein